MRVRLGQLGVALMEFSEFEARAVPAKPMPSMAPVTQLLFWSNGLGEVGEVQNVVKKMVRDGKLWDEELLLQLLDEAGDALFYLHHVLENRGLTMEGAAQRCLEKLEAIRANT